MNTAHGTLQVTDEQITILHLALQVYCSPSLKEYLHSPVMPLLARTIQRKEPILCTHSGVCTWCVCGICVCVCVCVVVCVHVCVCVCVCVVVVFEYMCVCLCVACGCVHMCTCTLCQCIHMDTNLQVQVHTSAIEQFWQLLIVWWGSC